MAAEPGLWRNACEHYGGQLQTLCVGDAKFPALLSVVSRVPVLSARSHAALQVVDERTGCSGRKQMTVVGVIATTYIVMCIYLHMSIQIMGVRIS
jgi:hypothetical protein